MKRDQKKYNLEIIDYNLMWFNDNIFHVMAQLGFYLRKSKILLNVYF